MRKLFNEKDFEIIKDYDYTKFTQDEWEDFVLSVASYFQKFRKVDTEFLKVELCIFKGDPMVVLTFQTVTYKNTNKEQQISLTPFEAELNFVANKFITEKWRKLLTKRFADKYELPLNAYLEEKENTLKKGV